MNLQDAGTTIERNNINLPHYVSKKRPRRSMEQRAAQFAPFAALTGFEDEIEEARIEFIKKMDIQ